MKKKLIVAAISSALVAPSAFAAQDDLGMQYTSAAEGFYGSLRARWSSNAGAEDTGANLDGSTFSRLGVRGTNDLGGGLEGYYQVEFNVGEHNNDAVVNRLRVVGLRGGFGAIEAGTFWDDGYNFVTGSTDLSPYNSGRFAPNFRVTGLQYRTPDLNGFQGSARFTMDDDSRTEVDVELDDHEIGSHQLDGNPANDELEHADLEHTLTTTETFVKDDNDLDKWSLSAKYSFQGFTVSGTYENTADGLPSATVDAGAGGTPGGGGNSDGGAGASKKEDDHVFWAIGMGYGQDNWSVSGWYGESDVRVLTAATDGDDQTGPGRNAKISDEANEIYSLAASVDVDKVTLYGVYENVESPLGLENAGANVGVLYRLGSNTNTWIEYVANDNDNDDDVDDTVVIGLRHNF